MAFFHGVHRLCRVRRLGRWFGNRFNIISHGGAFDRGSHLIVRWNFGLVRLDEATAVDHPQPARDQPRELPVVGGDGQGGAALAGGVGAERTGRNPRYWPRKSGAHLPRSAARTLRATT